ncbi:hypothetical protein Tco_0369994 [Tanacetum coccineum]
MRHFKGMTYDDIRPIFEKVWDQVNAFVSMDSELEIPKLKGKGQEERFQTTNLEGHELILWGDLKMIFDPDESNEIWMNQQDWKLMKWKLHKNCRVHSLFMWSTPMKINMLVEKEYPLTKETLKNMLKIQLEAEEESSIAFELIKFIRSQLEE